MLLWLFDVHDLQTLIVELSIRVMTIRSFGFFFQIRDFVKEVQDELSKPGFNSFGLGDCKAPKVLGDIVESIAGAIFLDSGHDTAVVWQVSLIWLTYEHYFLQKCPLRKKKKR